MIFSSYSFIFAFLPITFVGFFILTKFESKIPAKVWLILSSLYFYSQGSGNLLWLFVGTIIFNYILSLLIVNNNNKNKKGIAAKLLLAAGLIENIGLLCYFKYTNFFIANANAVFGTDITLKTIILPLGISFFTFQLITFIVDCYRDDSKGYKFLDYMVFITFFPKIIVGPIAHHKGLLAQITDKANYVFNSKNFMLGMFIFSVGCAKKILLADPLIDYSQIFYSSGGGGFFESWTAVLSYTFAYYFDFSSYGDMAIGLGLFFNLRLPINFNSPYKAANFAEFWRRWNITLSQFLNDYIFKSIYKFGNGIGKLFFAIIITFLVSGFWHGAGWHFIIWGLVNGVFVCIANYMSVKSIKLPFAISWAVTFFGVLMTRVLFDSTNMTQVFSVYKSMFSFADWGNFLQSAGAFISGNAYTMGLITICAIISFGFKNVYEITENFKPHWKYAAWAAILLTLALFRMGTVSNFLYFQF